MNATGTTQRAIAGAFGSQGARVIDWIPRRCSCSSRPSGANRFGTSRARQDIMACAGRATQSCTRTSCGWRSVYTRCPRVIGRIACCAYLAIRSHMEDMSAHSPNEKPTSRKWPALASDNTALHHIAMPFAWTKTITLRSQCEVQLPMCRRGCYDNMQPGRPCSVW